MKTPTIRNNIRCGMAGEDVFYISSILAELGYCGDVPKYKIDRNAAESIKRFQFNNNLTPDGIVGVETLFALLNAKQEHDEKAVL